MIIHQLFALLFKFALWVAYPFHKKARKFLDGRKTVFQQLEQFASTKGAHPVLWFHCASLGEFEQGRPVMERLKEEYPQYKIVLTFFSPSGYEVRKNYAMADVVCYLPLDSKTNAYRFVQLVQPHIAFFVKYEYWHFYLSELEKQHIPAIAISVIFLPHYTPFRWYGKFYHATLKKITHYFLQDQKSAALIQTIGIHNITVAGDTRFDRVAAICENVQTIPLAERFKSGEKLMVAGSSWPEDMEVLIPLIRKTDSLKFIIAPHNIHENELIDIEKKLEGKTVRYSRAQETTAADHQILIIDNIGMLTALYQYGELAYVGGAFRSGLHNILEPATFGMPIFFGNQKYHTFREAHELITRSAAFPVETAAELSDKCAEFLQDEPKRKQAVNACKDYVRENIGATDTIIRYLREKKMI